MESARVVALGEPLHGAHEPVALRNRLFEFLVEKLDFTAIAVETGFTRAWAVDDYVRGLEGDAAVARNVFHASENLWAENQQLIDWMRDYNARPSTTRPIRFYGVGLSGFGLGQLRTPRIAVDAALAYLDRVDKAQSDEFRDLAALLPYFNQTDHPVLEPAERNALTALLSDLVIAFERDRLGFVAVSGASGYERAYREAVVAQRVDALLRARAASPNDFRMMANVNDETMASNLEWVLEQEGADGRVFVFAGNWHVKTSPMWPDAYPEGFPEGRPATSMGEYLRSVLGEAMVVIGTRFGGGESSYNRSYARADPASVDGLLGRVGVPLMLVGLGSTSMSQDARDQLRFYRRVRSNDRYGELDVTAAFDALVYMDMLTPVVELLR